MKLQTAKIWKKQINHSTREEFYDQKAQFYRIFLCVFPSSDALIHLMTNFTNCSLKIWLQSHWRNSANSIDYPLADRSKRIQLAKRKIPYPPGMNQATGHVHQILDNGLDPSAGNTFFAVFREWAFWHLFKAYLANHPKHVICKHAQMKHQGIAGKMTTGQSFQIHIGFDLWVILFTGAMIMV